jgi:hypothetical protein
MRSSGMENRFRLGALLARIFSAPVNDGDAASRSFFGWAQRKPAAWPDGVVRNTSSRC